MSRKHLIDYAGAKGRISLPDLLKLDHRRYQIMEKKDGAYCHLNLDRHGRIERVISRTGEAYGANLTEDLIGQFVGWPDAVLIGELTAHTEAGNREAQTLGYRRIHLFDMLRGNGGRYLAKEPFSVRRDQLYRMHVELEANGPELPWYREPEGSYRDKASGRYCRPVPNAWRRTPIVHQLPPHKAGELWERVESGELEGLVAVAVGAKLGARNSKRKCKPALDIEATVIRVSEKTCLMQWPAGLFVVGKRKHEPKIGELWTVTCQGFYESDSSPKHPVLARRRDDLARQA